MGMTSETERARREAGGGGGARRELLGGEKGAAEGSGRVAGWHESVDRLLDASPRYNDALGFAFRHFCLPAPDRGLPAERLLSALQFFLERILEELDEKAGNVCLRPVTQEDVDLISRNDKTLARRQGRLIDFPTFDLYARHLLKRVALDRGKRLGLFMLGGMVVVHVAKSTVGRIPFVGAPISAFVNAVVPTVLAGPIVGVAGAMYMRSLPFRRGTVR